ncbi:Cytokine-induced anti-apoptosis inhibitor 1 [Penicillium riverlandense]|uniref:Cytokine-induced anti-apoptosis inhibitor 1 n=1 Tax=Penicillium riverlandense TaxID=1903569 RepID=UPI002548A5C0|nr:Cytokine-induced anti-apoptosis inhibitor 1 [Penicillium riverlandense]KAJ5819312.1 Cytokine-induced anti-apoptosis inhibitor 1 [Penicillium riverlandense]
MAPSVVTIDASDVDMAIPSAPISQKRTLLLAPPSIATEESNLHALFATFDRTTTDLQMLDRLSAGVVSLPANTYDLVLLVTGTDGSRRTEALQLLDRGVYAALVPAMKPGAKLQTQDSGFGPAETMEAVLAGLVQTPSGFEKPNHDASAAVPLRFGAKKNIPKKTTPPAPAPPMMGIIDPTNNNDRDDDDDELINEDSLLDDEDLSRPIMPPPECQPKTGRRRRACKDCTCGLADRLEAEDKERREKADNDLNVLKLQSDDLNELDFTVQGKTGSCGSCALGDAFRCDGCPYLGMPAFKPGQEVQILNEAQF